MDHDPAMWVLGPADSDGTAAIVAAKGYAGIISDLFAPAIPLGVNDFILRAPGSSKGMPKSLVDVFNLRASDFLAFHYFTMMSTATRRSRRVTFYVWYLRSAIPATPANFRHLVVMARSAGAGLCFDDWPDLTEEQRGIVDREAAKASVSIEPNWTQAGWGRKYSCLVTLSLWRAWKDRPETGWLLERTDDMPMRTIVGDFAPTESRGQVLANCADLVRECRRWNSRAALPVDIVRHGISWSEILAAV